MRHRPESTSQPVAERSREEQGNRQSVVSLTKRAVIAALLVPTSWFLAGWSLILLTNNLDVAFALGVPDSVVSAVVVGAGGLIAGFLVALAAGNRGWSLAVPPLVGMIVGVGVYLGPLALASVDSIDANDPMLVPIGLAQVVAIVTSTTVAGMRLAGTAVVVMVVGIGAIALVQSMPAAPARVFMTLDVFTVDGPKGECSGSGELTELREGSEIGLIEYSQVAGRSIEVGSVVLPAGFERGDVCRFGLGDPLDRPVDGYANVDFRSDPELGVPYSVSLEGNSVIFSFHHLEG